MIDLFLIRRTVLAHAPYADHFSDVGKMVGVIEISRHVVYTK